MFSKKQRLCRQKEIEAVFKSKVSVYNKLFGLKTVKNKLGFNRYTVIIGIKVSKLAIERNRIKRMVKIVLKENDSKIQGGIDCIVITLKEAQGASSKDIKQAIENLLQRSKLY